MIASGWQIIETGMNPYGEPTFLMGWLNPHDNPPEVGKESDDG
jgi:hypothetical protein